MALMLVGGFVEWTLLRWGSSSMGSSTRSSTFSNPTGIAVSTRPLGEPTLNDRSPGDGETAWKLVGPVAGPDGLPTHKDCQRFETWASYQASIATGGVGLKREIWLERNSRGKKITWNLNQPIFSGCFSWMIANLYTKNCRFTKHPLKNSWGDGCCETTCPCNFFLNLNGWKQLVTGW